MSNPESRNRAYIYLRDDYFVFVILISYEETASYLITHVLSFVNTLFIECHVILGLSHYSDITLYGRASIYSIVYLYLNGKLILNLHSHSRLLFLN